jgi:hypothetical protein
VIWLQTEANRMDILATGNYEKTLEELVQQLDKDRRELNEFYDHFIREYDLPTEPIMEAIDPESIYGKLILGSRLQLPKRSKVQPMFRLQMAQAQYRRIELLELISIRKQEQQRNDQPQKQKAGKVPSRTVTGSNKSTTNSSGFEVARAAEQQEEPEHHSATAPAPPAGPETTPQEYFQPKRKTARNGSTKADTTIAVEVPQLAEGEEQGQKEGGQPPGTDDHDSSGSDATQQSQPVDPGSGQQQEQQQTQQQQQQQHHQQQQGRRKHRGGRGRRGRTYVDAAVVGTGNKQGDS